MLLFSKHIKCSVTFKDVHISTKTEGNVYFEILLSNKSLPSVKGLIVTLKSWTEINTIAAAVYAFKIVNGYTCLLYGTITRRHFFLLFISEDLYILLLFPYSLLHPFADPTSLFHWIRQIIQNVRHHTAYLSKQTK